MGYLDEIYKKHIAKASGNGDKGTIHSYIDFYDKELAPYQHTAKTFLEIGINRGYSIRMWREYFSTAEVIGVDIKDRGVVAEGCTLIYNDATDPSTFSDYDEFDIIIDDGSHMFEHQIATFEFLYPKLKKGGIYYIEDVQDLDAHYEEFISLSDKVEIYDFRLQKNRYDDVIIKIKK